MDTNASETSPQSSPISLPADELDSGLLTVTSLSGCDCRPAEQTPDPAKTRREPEGLDGALNTLPEQLRTLVCLNYGLPDGRPRSLLELRGALGKQDARVLPMLEEARRALRRPGSIEQLHGALRQCTELLQSCDGLATAAELDAEAKDRNIFGTHSVLGGLNLVIDIFPDKLFRVRYRSNIVVSLFRPAAVRAADAELGRILRAGTGGTDENVIAHCHSPAALTQAARQIAVKL